MSIIYNFSTNPLFQRLKRTKDGPIFPVLGIAPNYMGPANSLDYKYLTTKKPINKSDLISRSHDLSYAYANNQSDPALTNALIRHADRKMLKRLKEHTPASLSDSIMRGIGRLGIGGKILGENLLQHDVEYGKKDFEDHVNIIDSLKKGGRIKKSGMYLVHRDELIV